MKIARAVASLILLLSSFPSPATSADTGLLSPTATGEDHNAWSTPTSAYSSNNLYAGSSTEGNMQDYYNFSFSIPAGAAINGVEVVLEAAKSTLSTNPQLVSAQVSYNGGTNYTATSYATTDLTTTDTSYTLGGPSNTWGRSWSDSEFSNANFRLRLRYTTLASVLEGSNILGADGVYRPVADLKVGNFVLSYNTETGAFFTNRVVRAEAHPSDHVYVINGGLRITASELIFAAPSAGGPYLWMNTDRLREGDWVLRENGLGEAIPTRVDTIEKITGEFTVYSIDTEKPFNNYWVDHYLLDPPSTNAGVDHAQVKVYYTESAPDEIKKLMRHGQSLEGSQKKKFSW